MDKEDSALDLWKRLILTPGWSPFVPSEIDGSLSCFFCSASPDEDQAHMRGCIYVAASGLIKASA